MGVCSDVSRAGIAFLVFWLVSIGTSYTQEWTRFRGPNGSGIGQGATIPSALADKDVRWRTSLPGVGHSSPVLWGSQLFLTVVDEQSGQFAVLSYQARDGTLRWKQTFPFETFRKHNYNTFASSTPTTDANRLYVSRIQPASYSVLALSHAGKVLWERDLGPFASQHGGGPSPVLHDGRLILANEQDGKSFLVALDPASGKTIWQTSRTTREAAYATPCVYEPKGGKPALIFNSEAHGISAVDPATGGLLWEFAEAFDKRCVSSPVIAGDLIIGSCGSGGGGNYVVAIRPGDPKTGAKPELAYSVRKSAPYVPTSVYVKGRLFLWSDGGIVSCVDAVSGEVKWQERVGGNYFGSPVWVDGRLIGVSSRGEVVVVSASDRFEVLGRYALNETVHSSPAVAAGNLYIHTTKSLVCIGSSAAQ